MSDRRVRSAAWAVCGSAAAAWAQPCEPGWAGALAGNGVAGSVECMAVYDAGSGPALYVGGTFTAAGGQGADDLARWDGRAWTPIAMTATTGVNDLCVYDFGDGPELYVAGFDLARYDGAQWREVGTGGPNSWIGTMHVFDAGQGQGGAELYVSGGFGWPHSYIAKWNGAAWSGLGEGLITVTGDMAAFDDGTGTALYCSGGPADLGPFEHSVGRWDGSAWSGLGAGTRTWGYGIDAMAVFDDGTGPALYVGGDFRSTNPPVNWMARWDGAAWSPVPGFDAPVRALLVHDDGSGAKLYAGGEFTTAGGVPARRLARWDGAAWEEVGGGTDGSVRALGTFDDGAGAALYVGGEFASAGGVASPGIARWGCELGCRADVDGSGGLSLADFVAFRNLYVAGDMGADFDGSGTLTLNDFVRFRNEYIAGCVP